MAATTRRIKKYISFGSEKGNKFPHSNDIFYSGITLSMSNQVEKAVKREAVILCRAISSYSECKFQVHALSS